MLSPLLISPRELSRLAKLIASRLPRDCNMITGTDVAHMHSHFQTARVSVWQDGSSLHIALSFPLQPRGSRCDVYEISAHPMLDLQHRQHLRLDTPYRYFVASQDGQYYATLERLEIEQCRTRPYLICPSTFPLVQRATPTCLSQLFFQETVQTAVCDWKLLLSKFFFSPASWTWDDPPTQAWYYALADEETISEHCPDEQAVEVRLKGNGMLQPQPRCTIRTKAHQLLPTGGVLTEQHHLRNRTVTTLPDWDRAGGSLPREDGQLEELLQRAKELGAQGDEELRLTTAWQLLEDETHTPVVLWSGGLGVVLTLALIGDDEPPGLHGLASAIPPPPTSQPTTCPSCQKDAPGLCTGLTVPKSDPCPSLPFA